MSQKETKDGVKNSDNEEIDHMKIGMEQELFFFDEVSPGSCFFLPHGATIYNKLMSLLRGEYKKRGFQEVITPVICKKQLWETSGHWEKYKENMFCFDCDNTEYALKSMNCPSHCMMFKHRVRSYKNLPIRLADFGALHRNEASGALGKLTRNRKFSQDDAHVFCSVDQIKSEMKNCIDFLEYIYVKIFNFTFDIELSTRPDNFIGDIKIWDSAEDSLKEILKDWKGTDWKINIGDGAFYGPKIDIHLKDSRGKRHQCATIQLDFNLPKRFELQYYDDNGLPQTPVIIHRAIFGSFERFISILCEHYNGNWPFWLSPRQVIVCPVSDKFMQQAKELVGKLQIDYIVDLDESNRTVQKKIREAQVMHYNYILVIGQKEIDNNNISVRYRDNGAVKVLSLQELQNELSANVSKFS